MRKAQDAPGQAGAQGGEDRTRAAAGEAGGAGGDDQNEGRGEMGYSEMVKKDAKSKDADGSDEEDEDGSDADDLEGPTDEEINEIFLKRYKMSKEELKAMADKMGIQLNNLCYLKQEFDTYDEDRSGYIDVKEL